jgi:hypothetical protein
LLLQLRECPAEVVDCEGDVAVGGAELITAAVVIQRELELLPLARDAEEVVSCFELTVARPSRDP